MNGVIGYEVPADWKTIEIHFKDNVWSSNKFKFEITKQADQRRTSDKGYPPLSELIWKIVLFVKSLI